MAHEQYTTKDFLRRKIDQEEIERIDTRIKNIKAMEGLLNLFGTEQARENFLDLCKQYRRAIWHQRNENSVAGNLNKIEKQDSSKSEIHNRIMDIIGRLSAATNDLQSTSIFSYLNERNKVGLAILDYLDHLEKSSLKEVA